MQECPFCRVDKLKILFENEQCFVVRDGFPVTPGHTLVVTRRHVASLFDATQAERQCLLAALDAAKELLDIDIKPEGYNVGINDGISAGQTVPHLHVHVIPRFRGDQDDPRGGVRKIFPTRADYRTE